MVNLLALPLYRRADKLQSAEFKRQADMKPWLDHIKKSFKGDERFMMLQTYYRENNYKPLYVLKGSLSLILQIPFFIAAYRFLSELTLLNGVSLGPIGDLGAPDSMFQIGTFSVNVLPIIMTLINVISTAVYTKGKPMNLKLQSYGIAFVFLILLYSSPAGLVFYWIMNQLFSLGKNIVYTLFPHNAEKEPEPNDEKHNMASTSPILFWGGCVLLTMLTGLLIPSNVICSSVAEFIDYSGYGNPLYYVVYTLLISTGYFLVWFGIYYEIAGASEKKIVEQIMIVICGIAVTDYFFFGKDLGLISSLLQYDTAPQFDKYTIIVNIIVLVAVSVALLVIYRKKTAIISGAMVSGALAILFLGGYNAYKINSEYTSLAVIAERNEVDGKASLGLSKDGKNVILLMLDRAMETMVPYIMNEKPELVKQFDGFTYYANTVSLGGFTNFCAPSVFGGYDYTPENLDKREDELLADKHNEALKVLPTLFLNEGYEVTICDPPHAGYSWTPDLSIYDEYDEIRTYITDGQFGYVSSAMRKYETYARKRNFFLFSISKISPLFIHNTLYDAGLYNSPRNQIDDSFNVIAAQERSDLSHSHGYPWNFMRWYSVLEALPSITRVEKDNDVNRFIMMSNSTTHEPCLLQEPDYTPAIDIDNSEYDHNMTERYTVNGITMPMESEIQVIHYHANIAALSKLGEWFDYLRKEGVYDNTRIILVSDHGRNIEQFGPYLMDGTDCEYFYPLFMVKDFDSKGFNISDEFMTNADAPSIAVKDVIADPINPFTGNRIDGHEKEEGPVKVIMSTDFDISKNNGKRFFPADWYSVYDNIYDLNNWTYLGNW